jgi:hypothetical protein
MRLRIHRSQAPERFAGTARIVLFALASYVLVLVVCRLLPYGRSLRSRLISEPLADDAHKGALGALNVIYAKANAIAIPKIELGKIAMQMAFAAMLVNAFHAAFEHAVEAFNGVGVNLAATIFPFAMVHTFMLGELASDRFVMTPFIGHQARLLADVGAHDAFNVRPAGAIDMEATGRAAALD